MTFRLQLKTLVLTEFVVGMVEMTLVKTAYIASKDV